MKQFKATLPFPITINHFYGQHGNRRYIKPKGKEFIENVKKIVAPFGVVPNFGCFYFPEKMKIKFTMRIWMPDRRVRDGDNLIKVTQDTCQKAGIYKNDRQIKKWDIEVLDEIIKGGKVYVEFEEFKNIA